MDNSFFNNETLAKDVERDEAFDAFLAGYAQALQDIGQLNNHKHLKIQFLRWWDNG